MNLIGNAIKFSSQSKTVMIKARLNKNLTRLDTSKEIISIEISDEGIGITKEEICNMFTPFFRSKNEQSREKNPNGNGLGLSICHNIAKSLQGDLTCVSYIGVRSNIFINAEDLKLIIKCEKHIYSKID